MSEPRPAIRLLRPEPFPVRPWEVGTLSGAAPPSPPAPRPDPTLEADALRTRALEEAESLHAAAREEAGRLREQARAEGHLQGLEEGRRQAQAECAQRRAEALALLEAIPAAWERFCETQRPQLVGVAVRAAERILQEQLRLEPERIQTIVRAALAHVTDRQRLVVHVHPDDVDLLLHAGLQEGGAAPPALLEADPQIQRGGCRIEGKQGSVDATLDGCLARLAETLQEE